MGLSKQRKVGLDWYESHCVTSLNVICLMYSYSGRQYSGNWRMLRNCFHDFIPGWTLFQSRLDAFSVRKRTWCLGGLLITWRWIDQTQWTMPESDLPIGFMCLQDSVRTSHRLDISYFEDIVFGIGLYGKQYFVKGVVTIEQNCLLAWKWSVGIIMEKVPYFR